MLPKLVLVEGLPGSGKSTTAQFLARQLRLAGHPASWHHEGETPHPVLRRPADSPMWAGYFADRLERWREFAAPFGATDRIWILLDRLGLSLVEAPAPSGAALRRVVGTYRGGGAASRRCAVALGGAGLVLDGLLWPSDPLLPLPSGGFEIESWPFELDFEEDGTGAVCAMRVTGPPLGWGRVDGVYERL
jgi:hypothetical protein